MTLVPETEPLVVDASVMVDLLARLHGHEPSVTACVDQRGTLPHTSMPRCSPLWDGWSEQAGSTT